MKLSGLTWFIVGLSVALVALSFAYFQYYEPNMQLAAWNDARSESLRTEIAKRPQAQRRVEEAKAMVEEKGSQWKATVATRTPPSSVNAGGINLAVNAWQLTVDSQRFRNSIQRAVNRQVRAGGVTVQQGPEIPSPDLSATTIVANYYNYPALNFPVVMFDLGAVVVRGTYSQITENVRAWSRMPNYLAVADGLTIQGTSPNLVGTYNLSIVGFIRGPVIHVPVPEGGAGTQGGGRGGGQPDQRINAPRGKPGG